MKFVRRAFVIAALALCGCATAPPTPEENAALSARFLERNATRAGIVTTASGLQYRVVRAIEGAPRPAAEDVVIVHYEGALPRGQVFDSSYERNEPAEFPLNRVIAGWTEGVQLMGVGDEYQFFIPPALAYGARGAGADIPANQALVFRVELLGVTRADGTEIRAP